MPLVGASEAVAALMGGFLVRFPKMKIEMGLYNLISDAASKPRPFLARRRVPVWLRVGNKFSGRALGA